MGREHMGQTDRRFPPFEETLERVILPDGDGRMAFDATIARPDLAGPAPADGAATPLGEELLRDLRVVELLGAGGMGQVHLAEQRSLAREVAVKTVHPDCSPTAAAALREEALVTGQIEHPSVIPVHALGRSADGRPIMVMKRIEGTSWKELLESPEHPHWETISGEHGLAAHLEILAKVCHAVAFAHSRGIVHRDLKPENVMIGRFGEVYLVDWGLAVRLAHQPLAAETPQPVVGTPAYMAPEMVAGQPVDERTDVYLLGAILHELLTGAPPHGGETMMAVLAAAYVSEPKDYDAEVPAELASLCRDAMRQDPADRPATVLAFRDRLVGHLQHRASTAISRRGHERLGSLSRHDLATAEGRLAVRQGLIECRFAFLQALEEWGDNESAARGLRICGERAVRVEVADGHGVAARAALHGLDHPPRELVAEVEALERRLAGEREEAKRLRQFAHDHDMSVGGAARRGAAFVFAGLAVVMSVAVAVWRADHEMEPADLVRVGGFMVLAGAALFAILHRRLLSNAFGRKVTYLGGCAVVAQLVHRVLAAHAGQPPPVILATDLLIFTVFLVAAGIAFAPRLAAGAVFSLAGSLAAFLYPERAPTLFSVFGTLMVVTSALFIRSEKDSKGAAAKSPAA
jgi:eukaryotic-like serine/threonine-protein kinase